MHGNCVDQGDHACERVAPGRYECQVTVLEPTGEKAAFWQAPVIVVP